MTDTPERLARREIDARLEAAGWRVQDRGEMDLTAGRGVAVREFPLRSGFGFADYLLYVDRLVAGVIEAKAASTLTGVEAQSAKYSQGVPDNFSVHDRPLPYLFESNGAVTCFTNLRDPTPRSRPVFHFPRPETLADWLEQPETLRSRLKKLPELDEAHLWSAQARAIRNLEASLGRGRPRALVQMATGSGKTFTAVNAAYRLLKHGGARRILFLVDRSNLGHQTYNEFANFQPPDDARKFPELYTVQRLTANAVNPAAKVVVTTVQRVYSMLRGEVEYDAGNEEGSAFDSAGPWAGEPPRVEYNAALPPEFFDFVVVDECHRSIYDLWSQVLLCQFRDKVLPAAFPGRGEVPKTLIFAKDDSHADDIVRLAREEFAEGNEFCRKITYRTGFTKVTKTVPGDDGDDVEVTEWVKTSSMTPDELLANFRNSFFPRMAVTVDMISTGADVKPIECVFFMRNH